MGKKGGWFSAVRKALMPSYDSKEKKDKKPPKSISKKSWFGKQKSVDIDSPQAESAFATPALRSPPPEPVEEPELKTPENEPSNDKKLENEPSNDKKPENEPSKPTKPEDEPSKPTKPEDEPSKPTKPEDEPIKSRKPEDEPSKPTKPEDEPSKPTKPEDEPSKPTKPEDEPSKPTKPEDEPSKPTKPENEPSKPMKPENQPSKPTKPENQPSKPTKPENERLKRTYSVAYATARAAEAAAAAAHAAAEVVRLTSAGRFLGKSKEEIAAIKIQTAFRSYLGRKELRALRGCRRLKALVQSQAVKRQATTTLRCMQTLARVQSQVRARRIRMSEENQALQRQLMEKRERELDNMRTREWENSRRTKEQLEASIQSKQEAAARRERALAYAQTHQQMWRNSSKTANPTFMDPNNPHWGWSWLERWMAARPWESQSTVEPDHPPAVRTMTRSSSVGDVSKSLSRSPSMSSSSPKAETPKSARKQGPSSPKVADDDTRSLSQRNNRRHSIANSSFREETSRTTVSSPKSTKTRSMIPSPSPLGSAKKGGPEKKTMAGTVKKRLSLSGVATGNARRLSGPPRMGSSPKSR